MLATTVGLLLAGALCALAEAAVAILEVEPAGLDVLLAATQGTGAQVHGDGVRSRLWRIEEDHPKELVIPEEIVVCGMPGKQACLADLLQRQNGSRGVTLLGRPTDKRTLR